MAARGQGGRALWRKAIRGPIICVTRSFDALPPDAVRPRDSTQIGLERPPGLRFERRQNKLSALGAAALTQRAEIASKILRGPSANSKDFRCMTDYNGAPGYGG